MKQTLTASGIALVGVLSLAQAQQAPEPAASTPTAVQLTHLCEGCAWVRDAHVETRGAKSSGLGAVGGAVLGGLIGNQVGGGTGKAVATLGGAAAGGYAGNKVEKDAKKTTVWVVDLIDKDGLSRRVELAADPQLRIGDVVRERDGQLQRQ